MTTPEVTYSLEPDLGAEEFLDVLARSYYPRIGMAPHDSCWVIPRIPPSGPST